MNWNKWIWQIHRWLSIIFTLTVAANFIAMALGKPPSWIVYSRCRMSLKCAALACRPDRATLILATLAYTAPYGDRSGIRL